MARSGITSGCSRHCPAALVVVERDPDTGTLVGYVPGWPGAHAGHHLEELQANLSEVIEMLLEDGEAVLESEFVDVRTIQVA